jgi:hypothetical protein
MRRMDGQGTALKSIPVKLATVNAWTAATLDWALGYGSWFGRPGLDGRPDQVKPFQMTANRYAMSVWRFFVSATNSN